MILSPGRQDAIAHDSELAWLGLPPQFTFCAARMGHNCTRTKETRRTILLLLFVAFDAFFDLSS